jgi:hypothetical protein
LNIVVDSGSNRLGYETILVVLEPGEKPESPTTVINNVKVSVKIKTVFVFPREPPIEGPNPPELPICDEDTPLETPCRDEGDPDDCEPGFVDRGFGCESEEPEPPICTPDGPPCPPCPEGVEAGWCADEDEQQDTDDFLDLMALRDSLGVVIMIHYQA